VPRITQLLRPAVQTNHAGIATICDNDVTATEAELIGSCHARIANYKCPRSITLRAEPLPLSGAGKILKAELRKPFWEGQARRVN
jgi:long-chain acyl-CoA synthetase